MGVVDAGYTGSPTRTTTTDVGSNESSGFVGVPVCVGVGVADTEIDTVAVDDADAVEVADAVAVTVGVADVEGDAPMDRVAEVDAVCEGDEDGDGVPVCVGDFELKGDGCKYAFASGGNTTPLKNPASAVVTVVSAPAPVSYRNNVDGVVP